MDNKAIKYSVFLFGIACVLAGVVACLFDRVAGGGVVIATGLVLFLFSQFEIEYFKMPGLEAKLRMTIHEAEVTLEALRKIIVPISEISISLAARTGRVGVASSNKEMHELSMRIKKELSEIKVPDHDIDNVLYDWYFYTAFDMGRVVIEPFINLLNEKENKLRKEVDDWVGNKPVTDQDRYAQLLEPVRKASIEANKIGRCLWKKDYQDIPDIIRTSISNCSSLNELEKEIFWKEVDEEWRDLTHFVKEKQLRRSEKWLAKEVS
ncbi:hypothetical protein [Pantoea agglomerans]|uniref:hypothetical protein n=1 Tax=Enterobacter agglomerans TaxID=549 RepID=UPI003C7E6774